MAKRHRRPRSSPAQLRYLAKLRAAGLKPLTFYVSQDLVASLADRARVVQHNRSVLVEAALREGLRVATSSAIQNVARLRRASASEHGSTPLAR